MCVRGGGNTSVGFGAGNCFLLSQLTSAEEHLAQHKVAVVQLAKACGSRSGPCGQMRRELKGINADLDQPVGLQHEFPKDIGALGRRPVWRAFVLPGLEQGA